MAKPSTPVPGAQDISPLPLDPNIPKHHVVPAEHVCLHRLSLPIRSKRQRLEALPFALEDTVATNLEKTHFAICQTYPDGEFLAATIDTSIMDRLLAEAPDIPILPEQMLLAPEPQTGEDPIWAVFRHNDRLIIRLPDGTGFAANIPAFTQIWIAAGKPILKNYGAPLPGNVSTAQFSKNGPTPVPFSPSYDLRQGPFRPALGLMRPMQWLAAGIALAALAHIALAIANLQAQTRIADTLQAEANTVLAAQFDTITAQDSPALLQRHIMAKAQAARGSDFLPLMDRVSQAWLRDGAALQIQKLTWDDNTLRLQLEAANLEALQQAQASLANADLTVTSGPATADAGSARAEFVVRP